MRGAIVRPASRTLLLAATSLVSAGSLLSGQATPAAPWTVEITTSPRTLAIGSCSTVYLGLKDVASKDTPRDARGTRVSMADFDMKASGATESTVVGNYNGANSFSVCACQAAVTGSEARITATYPAATVAARKAQVSGVAFESAVTIPIVAATGTNQPSGCSTGRTVTVAGGDVSTTASASTPTMAALPVAMATATPASAPPATTASASIATPPIGVGTITRPEVAFYGGTLALLTVNGVTGAVNFVAGGGKVSGAKAAGGSSATTIEPFVVNFTPGQPIQEWINATWNAPGTQRSGTLLPDMYLARPGDRAFGQLAFGGASIVSVSVPTLDAASRDRGWLRGVFTAGSSGAVSPVPTAASVSQAVAASAGTGHTKQWSRGNFRLSVENLVNDGITRVESFTVGLQGITNAAGAFELVRSPQSSGFPNLLVTIDASKAATWMAWYDDVVLKGNGGAASEKTFLLELMSTNGTTILATLKGYGVGIVALRAEPSDERDKKQRLQAELYVTRMEFVMPAAP